MKKRLLKTLCSLIIIGSIGILISFSAIRDKVEMVCYDLFNKNDYIDNKAAIQNLLASFKTVSLDDLPKEYLSESQLNHSSYLSLTKGIRFYVLKKKDCYKKIIGNNRIKDLISKDNRYKNLWYFSDQELYWGIDQRVLFKALELQEALKQLKLNQDAIQITSGHRTPQQNKLVNGASKSRHIKGQALDFWIGDVNKDGKYTSEDKAIVLELCDKKIIGNKGGIGLYPGTQVVHIDVRGRRARWNSY
ncbi:D-Ala-D-Ala carboxypeptidase family metallohydrolase [Aureispira sp. CCB-QB1]|uniref:YcbK family protein n=1 Tax=Aureispira sp. CCB-QB1 TaxID=1313421 RepID=UPI000696E5F4|nr:D-Ala-D-Ala carboxypeptidase family metallohydrolase [Aureispira sp. CCB-QB1]